MYFVLLSLMLIIGYDWISKYNNDRYREMEPHENAILPEIEKSQNENDASELAKMEKDAKDRVTDKKKDIFKEKTVRKININKAGISEMIKNLKGIGPAKAKLIILYRKSKGNFSNIEEIKNIKGIGEKIFNDIRDKITV